MMVVEFLEDFGHVHLDEVEDDGLIGAEEFAGRDPKQQRVTDLAGCAGDRHANG
ncbi:MAG: hypothetical protein RMK20_02925 [Verrucomicrobiales bacterium]|nr:hypothetical protein [Verrucomicrobiales bacterium]